MRPNPPHSPQADQESAHTIPLFLYGTLRPGESHHGLIAPFLESCAPARAWGRLHQLPAGYPALEVPEEAVLAHGTTDPDADAVLAHAAGGVRVLQPPDTGRWVEGVRVTLRNPLQCLPQLDDYEDFRPGQASLYRRILIAIDSPAGATAAWVYACPKPGIIRRSKGGDAE